jgi:hypothetical protein
MRGLNVRVAYARAVVLAVIDVQKCGEALHDVLFDAEVQGFTEYKSDIFEVPVMFQSVPLLELAWESGQATACDFEIAAVNQKTSIEWLTTITLAG